MSCKPGEYLQRMSHDHVEDAIISLLVHGLGSPRHFFPGTSQKWEACILGLVDRDLDLLVTLIIMV